MWSFVQSKRQQRWLWHAIDHQTGNVLAYVLAAHEDAAGTQLQHLLAPFSIGQFYTDSWGAYLRLLNPPTAAHRGQNFPRRRLNVNT
jgi:insertion element IS1 protein InsB